jgi:hypothetical protein
VCELSDDQTSLADADSATTLQLPLAPTLMKQTPASGLLPAILVGRVRNIFDGNCHKILINASISCRRVPPAEPHGASRPLPFKSPSHPHAVHGFHMLLICETFK